MKKVLSIVLLSLLIINCKKSEQSKEVNNQNIETNDTINKIVEKSDSPISKNIDKLDSNYWSFYNISETSISGNPKKTKTEIINQFKNIKINIDNKNIKIDNLCSFEYYKSEKTLTEYYESGNSAKLYESIFLKNGLKFGKTISVYQSLYPEKSCEMPWDELLIIDNTLVITYDDYLVFFKKGNDINQNDCYSKTKITNLPIDKSVIDGNNVWNELECSIEGLDTKDYLRLPDVNDIKVFIIGNFNFDDFTYTLVTIKNNKIITKKEIGFVVGGEDGNTISEITEFDINKDYVFNLNTKSKKGDGFKVIKQGKFRIDENGLVVVAK